MIVTILVFLLILSVLVLVHEAGHYFVAKKLGVKVEEFGFGFPPRVFGKKFGETIYSLNLLPIGGFVKLYGEDDAGGGKIGSVTDEALKAKGTDLKRAFFARSPWQRALIVIAGVVMNFILAIIILSYLFAVQGVPVEGNRVVIAGIAKNSPAAIAGLKEGDTIFKVDNLQITSSEQVIAYTKNHLGKQIEVEIITPKKQYRVLDITPRMKYPAGEGAMGVAIGKDVTLRKYPWYQAPFIGTQEALKQTWMIVLGLKDTLVQLFSGKGVPAGIAGPVGIAQLTGQFIQVGPNAVLSLVALLSLNLAIMNVLPIPALDGGRLFFILIEAFTGKKVHPKYEGYAHAVGMVFLLGLIVLITAHDLFRVFTHQPLIK